MHTHFRAARWLCNKMLAIIYDAAAQLGVKVQIADYGGLVSKSYSVTARGPENQMKRFARWWNEFARENSGLII